VTRKPDTICKDPADFSWPLEKYNVSISMRENSIALVIADDCEALQTDDTKGDQVN